MIIPAGYGQASFIHGLVGSTRPSVVTLGVNLATAGGTLTDQADILRQAWEDNILAAISVSIQLRSVLLKKGPNSTGASVEVPSGAFGTDSGPSGGPQVAFLVQKQTSQGGRTGRGRWYIPGVPEGSIGPDGVISGGKVALLQSKVDDFWSDIVAADIDPVLLHGEGVVAESPYLIENFVVQSLAATQRRRLRK